MNRRGFLRLAGAAPAAVVLAPAAVPSRAMTVGVLAKLRLEPASFAAAGGSVGDVLMPFSPTAARRMTEAFGDRDHSREPRESLIEAARGDQGDGEDSATAVPSQSVEKVAPVATDESDGSDPAAGPGEALGAEPGSNSRDGASERSVDDLPRTARDGSTRGDSRRDGPVGLGSGRSGTSAPGRSRPTGVSVLAVQALVCLPLLLLVGCTDPDQARQTASLYGFTDVVVDGYAWNSCGKDDSYATRIHARGANGQCADAVVCSGWAKGATLRVLGPSNACRAIPELFPAPSNGEAR